MSSLEDFVNRGRELWAALSKPYEDEETAEYLEACEIVCGKCGFKKPAGAYCVMCPVKYNRERLEMKGAGE